MSERRVVALLGRRDEPTDAVEDYCRYLGDALQPHGFAMRLERVAWNQQGWPSALRDLRQKAREWRGSWVLVQYTALAWSRRGFPLKFLRVISALSRAEAKVAIVYHDGAPYRGERLIDGIRSFAQLRTMRDALGRADLAVFTTPLQTIRWLEVAPAKATFIPVGANFPAPQGRGFEQTRQKSGPPRVAVFGITGGVAGQRETAHIVAAVRFAASQLGRLQLSAFGRNADEFESALREGLRDVAVDVLIQGLLPQDELSRQLCSSDVMLFVRGAISSGRGSALAGIACGLPVVGYKGDDTVGPITEAGVVLVPYGSPDVGKALLQVLSDHAYRKQLAEASRRTYEKYFSWAAIAARVAEELQKRIP